MNRATIREIANESISNLEYEGYETEEMIMGFIQAVVKLAKGDDVLLDRAANLLADGGVDSAR